MLTVLFFICKILCLSENAGIEAIS